MEFEQFRRTLNAFLKVYYDGSKALYQKMALPELTQKQFKYLKAIDHDPTITMSDLAQHFNLSKPSITDIIQKFETAGLIAKERSLDDGRIMILKLTELGKVMANTNQLESEAFTEHIFHTLSDEELTTLHALLQKVGTHPWYLDGRLINTIKNTFTYFYLALCL